jgi:hypothetical protein
MRARNHGFAEIYFELLARQFRWVAFKFLNTPQISGL